MQFDFQSMTEKREYVMARKVLHQQKIVQVDEIHSETPDSIQVTWDIVGSRVYLEGVVIQWRQSKHRYQQFKTATVQDTSNRRWEKEIFEAGSCFTFFNFRYIISGLDASTEYDVFLQPFYGTVVGLPTSISSIKTKTQQILRKTEILVCRHIFPSPWTLIKHSILSV